MIVNRMFLETSRALLLFALALPCAAMADTPAPPGRPGASAGNEGFCPDKSVADSQFGTDLYCKAGTREWTPPSGTRFVLVQLCGGGSSGSGQSGPGGNGTAPITTLVALRDDKPVEILVGAGGAPVSASGAPPNPGGASQFGSYVRVEGAPVACAPDRIGLTCFPGGDPGGAKGTNSPYAKGGAGMPAGSDWDWKASTPGGSGGGAGFGPGGLGGARCHNGNQLNCPTSNVSLPGSSGGMCAGGGAGGQHQKESGEGKGYVDAPTSSGSGGDGMVLVIPITDPGLIKQSISETLNRESPSETGSKKQP